MSRLNLWYLPPAFFSQAGHGGGQLPAFPAPSLFRGSVLQHHSGAYRAARMQTYDYPEWAVTSFHPSVVITRVGG
jgi:hypothetical protein